MLEGRFREEEKNSSDSTQASCDVGKLWHALSRVLLNLNQRSFMLSYAITFLIIALIAGVLGFSGIAGTAASIAHILFVVFLVLFVVSLIVGRRPPV
jgi:uncharacterized membrane protein YtjA (UPF0391 family)